VVYIIIDGASDNVFYLFFDPFGRPQPLPLINASVATISIESSDFSSSYVSFLLDDYAFDYFLY